MTTVRRSTSAAPEFEPLDPWLFVRIAGSTIYEIITGNIRDGHRHPRRVLADLPALRATAHRSVEASFDQLEDELRADMWRPRPGNDRRRRLAVVPELGRRR